MIIIFHFLYDIVMWFRLNADIFLQSGDGESRSVHPAATGVLHGNQIRLRDHWN